ncbi:MAG: Tol-Pal system beta propeller repeat protein TolB [Gammaproteobacteria bacterium]|jgi:TolB protein
MTRIVKLLILACVFIAAPVRAALTIEITQGMEGAIPIAVVPLGWRGTGAAAPENIAAIIAADLNRSGRFESLPDRDLVAHPVTAEQVKFQNWRMLNVDNLVIGQLQETTAGQYAVQFELFDVFRGTRLTGATIPAPARDLRRVAHHISDLIYETLTGERGAFNTQIAYVTSSGNSKNKTYTLLVADSDGYSPQTILTSKQPLMSPSWSPDGRRIAYVSFENKTAEIYIQEVLTGSRRKLASFKGINGAPAWSPDGSKLALTLSRDGNPEIYVMNIDGGDLRRLTNSAAIDTEPVWAPDGRSIVFTSNRGGSAQLYRVSTTGGPAQRLTFEGKYNAGADISPDGRKLVMVHGEGGRYRIAVLDLDSGLLRILTDGQLDESPSFSPNGSMIIYATGAGNREVLSAVSVDGRFRQRLSLQAGNVREPVWSPFGK